MDELKELGLNDKEISAYVTLIKHGSLSIWEISTKIGIKRTSMYDIIKSLLEKKLILKKTNGKKVVYNAVEPDYLKELINIKQEKISEAVKKLKLLKESNADEKNQVIIYTGIAGLKTIANIILLEKNQILRGFGTNQKSKQILGFYPENFAQKRIDRNIELRAIIEPKSNFYAENEKFNKKTKIKHHLLMNAQETVTFLINEKTIIFNLSTAEPIAILLEDKAFYSTQLSIFEHLWKEAR
jgi:HTH-type transcriptional regulator, sugar sensing transcriptional regulator